MCATSWFAVLFWRRLMVLDCTVATDRQWVMRQKVQNQKKITFQNAGRFDSVLCQCRLGDRKGIWSVKKWVLVCLVVTYWLELWTSCSFSCYHSPPASRLAPTKSRVETFWYGLTQVRLENSRQNGDRENVGPQIYGGAVWPNGLNTVKYMRMPFFVTQLSHSVLTAIFQVNLG